jgi:hypothetical protein
MRAASAESRELTERLAYSFITEKARDITPKFLQAIFGEFVPDGGCSEK